MSHYIVERRGEYAYAVLGPNPNAGKDGAVYKGKHLPVCTTDGLDDANLICNALNAQRNVAAASPLRGEFVRIDVNDPRPMQVSKNPMARAHAAMVGELARVVVPRISMTPQPEEFEDVADYILRTARMFDRWHKAVGEELNRNTTHSVQMDVFDDAFLGAVDGNSTYACDHAAELLRAEYGEAEQERSRGRHVETERVVP